MKVVISINYRWNTIAWAKNHASGTLNSKFIMCQKPYQLHNLKILFIFQSTKTHISKLFGIM